MKDHTPAPQPGREISCRVTALFLEEAHREGRPPEELARGTGHPPEHLADPRARISWDAFRTLLANANRLWGEDRIAEIVGRYRFAGWNPPIGLVARHLFAPGDLFRWIADPAKGEARRLIGCAHFQVREVTADWHEIRLVLDEGYEPSHEFAVACRGSLVTAARVLGLPDATVEMREDRGHYEYSVYTPSGGAWIPRVKRSLAWMLKSRSAARELRQAFETLHASRDKLRREVARRTQVEAELRRSETHFRSLVERAPIVLFALDRDGVFTLSEGQGLKNLGLEPGEVVGVSVFDFYADHEQIRAACRRALAGEELLSSVEVDGRFFETWYTPLRDSRGNLVGTLGVSTDVTSRHVAERALREQEALLRAAFDNFPYEFWAMDADGRYTMQNAACRAAWGSLLGKTVDDLDLDEELKARFRHNDRRALAGEVLYNEYEWARPGSGTHSFQAILAPIRSEEGIHGLVGVNIDVTDRKRLEVELRRKHRMESLGTLAGGIAHDFNNVLSVILGNTQLALSKVPAGDPARNLGEILTAGRRARDLVEQILAFSRAEPSARAPLALQLVIEDAVRFLRSTLPPRIELRTRLAAAEAVVEVNSTQIYQVVMNLGSNSLHAMRDDEAGVLEIAFEPTELDAHSVRQHLDLEPGPYVRLTVRDTGHGIEPHVLERIFDPFFSTKDIGEGSGLGLSVVHGIVREHGGAIHVRSRPEKGTSVEVLLPRMRGPSGTRPSATRPRGSISSGES